MTDNLEAQNQPAEKTFESFRSAVKPDGWITTNGVFYPCTPKEHDESAKFILKTHAKYIDTLLESRAQYSFSSDDTFHRPREILIAAGYALLSDKSLVDSNLPEKLTLKQMEFVEKNKIPLIKRGGELTLAEYVAFQERMKTNEYLNDLVKRKSTTVIDFLENPTETIHIEEHQSYAEKLFDSLSQGHNAEIRLEIGKGKITWRRVDTGVGNNTYVESFFHDHGYEDTYPETETWITLNNREGIKDTIEKYKKNGRYWPYGDLDALNQP